MNFSGIAEMLSEGKASKLEDSGKISYLDQGTTRNVYLSKCKTIVYKISNSGAGIAANRNEYAISKGLDNTDVGKLFAKCHYISRNAKVVCQDYYPNEVPVPLLSKKFEDFLYCLQDNLDFDNYVNVFGWRIIDLHPNNVCISPRKSIKIIDYGSRPPGQFYKRDCDLRPFIRKLKKHYRKLGNIKAFYNRKKELVVVRDKQRTIFV